VLVVEKLARFALTLVGDRRGHQGVGQLERLRSATFAFATLFLDGNGSGSGSAGEVESKRRRSKSEMRKSRRGSQDRTSSTVRVLLLIFGLLRIFALLPIPVVLHLRVGFV
jgi:hypothetical protein